MFLQPGTRLGNYEVLSDLGRGGMGEVYKARDLKLGREVAIKVLPQEMASDSQRLRRFEQEARAASALNHPNIVTIYEIGEHDGTPYIAMEYVEGRTLREILADCPLPNDRLIRYATQMAEGLAKAHQAGIVHRDLKPENIVISNDGYVKILDFGLAKLMPSQIDSETTTMERTKEGVIVGTLQYMSPEQAAGRAVDFHSDQFSFGSIVYEMATGKRPFERDTAAATLAAIIEGEAEPVEKVNPQLPAHLRAIVERCLEKHPEERYESTRDLDRELEGLRETRFELSALLTRRTVLAGVSALVILGLVLLMALNLGGFRDRLLGGASRIDSLAVLPMTNASGDPEQEYFVDGITEALITDLAKISALKVISRNSAMRYKDTDKSIAEIARELGVDAVIEGSVLREGERVRITAQLVEARTDQYLWADNFDRELRDVMTLYSDVARAIAQQIEIAVTPEEERRLAGVRPVDPEAYEAYLKGTYHWNKLMPEDIDTAERYFELAFEKDPSYAPAYAGLAWVWAARQQTGLTPSREAGPKAKAAALQAVALDDGSAGAHEALAMVRAWTDWDWAAAEPEFRRALELDPNRANTHAYFGVFLATVGRIDEGVRHSERAIELDPFNALFHGLYAQVLNGARRYDEAIAASRTALTIEPGGWDWEMQCALFSKGMRDELLGFQRNFFAGDPELVGALEQGLAEAGYEGAERRIAGLMAARYEKSGRGMVPLIAESYLYAGDDDRAMDWLEKAFEVRDPMLPYIRLDPIYDPVRSDPRFQDLLRRMNFPD